MLVEADARRLEPARKTSPLRSRPSAKQPAFPAKDITSEQPFRGKMPNRNIGVAASHGSTFFTPHQSAVAYQMAKHNDPLGTLGKHIENFMQLKQIGQQVAHMFDPRSKQGVANDAMMFYGGPGEDTTSLMNKEMPGQFERYSPSKSAIGGHLSSDSRPYIPVRLGQHMGDAFEFARSSNPQMRMVGIKALHDHFFGGEVHATGEIPKQPTDEFNAHLGELRKNDLLAKRRATEDWLRKNQEPKPSYDAAAAQKGAEMRALRRNKIDPRMEGDRSELGFQQHDPTLHNTYRGSNFRGDKLGPGLYHEGAGQDASMMARRQAILARYYQQQAFNHGGYPN